MSEVTDCAKFSDEETKDNNERCVAHYNKITLVSFTESYNWMLTTVSFSSSSDLNLKILKTDSFHGIKEYLINIR